MQNRLHQLGANTKYSLGKCKIIYLSGEMTNVEGNVVINACWPANYLGRIC